MKHARADYQNRIVDLSGKIPETEPVFLLRAKDLCSPAALHSYLTELVTRGADRDIIANVNAALLMFAKFQAEHAEVTKLPNIGMPEELPISDSPILQKALNDIVELEEKNVSLASSFNRVIQELDGYAKRYSEMKTLQENTVKELSKSDSIVLALTKEVELKANELTELKFKLKTSEASISNLQAHNKNLTEEIGSYKTTITSMETEIENLKTALKKEIDSNAV